MNASPSGKFLYACFPLCQRALPSRHPAGAALHPLGCEPQTPKLLTQLFSAAAGTRDFRLPALPEQQKTIFPFPFNADLSAETFVSAFFYCQVYNNPIKKMSRSRVSPPAVLLAGGTIRTSNFEHTHSPPQRKESFYSIFSRKNCGCRAASCLRPRRAPKKILYIHNIKCEKARKTGLFH